MALFYPMHLFGFRCLLASTIGSGRLFPLLHNHRWPVGSRFQDIRHGGITVRDAPVRHDSITASISSLTFTPGSPTPRQQAVYLDNAKSDCTQRQRPMCFLHGEFHRTPRSTTARASAATGRGHGQLLARCPRDLCSKSGTTSPWVWAMESTERSGPRTRQPYGELGSMLHHLWSQALRFVRLRC
ncbi:hypothetical protein GY45DRAFT_767705 [Cubamyces sp. BRFM 1775]|nr:hypothetical protein GY45DRAFT_767705 [Cubamyces sp. BRFM 1775]